ncbi:cytochrome P450 [Paenibacillus sp. CC-CFT747]|nr:cytochrome P450 [Paenibacillus sp. CC-CFT747]
MEWPVSSKQPDIAAWFRQYSDSLHRDPYSFYRYLLEEEPVYFLEERRTWVVSRYEDVTQVLKDPVFVKEYRNAVPPPETAQAASFSRKIDQLFYHSMLNRDAPVHTRLRRSVSHAFTPNRMARLQPKITEIAEQLTHQLEEEAKPDLIASFAFPLPVIVIAEILGVPAEDRELFKAWSHTFARDLDGTDSSLNLRAAPVKPGPKSPIILTV